MRTSLLLLIVACARCLSGCADEERVQEEINDPLVFLTVKASEQKSSADTLEGYLINHARYTSYGNIHLLVTYYSGRGDKIGSEYKAIYNPVPPGRRVPYKFDITPPPPPQVETREIVMTITDASPVPE